MSSYNRATLIGRLGKDPEVRYTNTQQCVANFSIATSENYTKDGNKVEKTEWHNIVVWGKPAEACSKFVKKGSLVLVEGRIQTREWQDKEGNKRFTTEIVANSVQFLSSKGENDSSASQAKPKSNSVPKDDSIDDIPF